MQMGFGLIQEQTQKLVMTTQMKQAIEVLQCSSAELEQYVDRHLSDNPLAEYEPPRIDMSHRWEARVRGPYTGGTGGLGSALPLEQMVRSEATLGDVIERQLRFMRAPSAILRAACYVAGCLDESGYVVESDEDLAQIMGVPVFVVTEAIALIQNCDPLGIGARNLKECLSLQLSLVEDGVRDLVFGLIEHHLEDVAAGKIPAIAKQRKRSVSEVQKGVDALRRLNPRPGLAYQSGKPEYVLPDVIVEKNGTDYVVLTNDGSEPKIFINHTYRKLMEHHANEEAAQYLQKKLQSAEWIVRCLEQRRITLYRVAQAIVEYQRPFFEHGKSRMLPLTLRQIADTLQLHESTVSRATRGKYMQTPRGVFEMRYFFTSELQNRTGGSTSAEAVKHQIRQCIEREDAAAPLSDDAIAKQLGSLGVQISRRTVAKYREEMDIPTSARRKRF